MKPTLTKPWLQDYGPEGYAIRLDWDNGRHHAVNIDPPCGREQVCIALQRMFELVMSDEHLK